MVQMVTSKLLKASCRVLLGNYLFEAISSRSRKTKYILHGEVYNIVTVISKNPVLKFILILYKLLIKPVKYILDILLFPIVVVSSLFRTIIKIIMAWILPEITYISIKRAIDSFYQDITSKNVKYTSRTAFKRALLLYEMHTKGRERKASFGEKNPDKTFYVVRPIYYLETNVLVSGNIPHLLAHYYRTLQYIAYAVEKGWTPVVDWENYGPFRHGEDYPINGTRNCWEYFWKQPSEYTLEEVYKSKNVVLSQRDWINNQFLPAAAFTRPIQKHAEQYAIRGPKYDRLINLNDYTNQYIQEKQDELFPPNCKILGCSIRGVSYGEKNMPGHAIQPDMSKLIYKIHEVMLEWGMDYLYFVCEAEYIVNEIQKEFGERVFVLPRMRFEKSPTVEDNPLYVPGQRYQTNLDYLTEIVLLSRCHSLLAGASGGVRAALIWNRGNYENMQIIDSGIWQ